MPRPYGFGDVRGYPVGGGHARPVFFPAALGLPAFAPLHYRQRAQHQQ